MWDWDNIVKKREDFTRQFSNFFVFDIETIKDSDMFNHIADEREIELDKQGEFLSIVFHKIVAISYLTVKNGDVIEYKSIVSNDEQYILENFWNAFIDAHSFKKQNSKKYIHRFPVLITVNGKDFDIPVIKTRTLKYINKIREDSLIRKFVSIFLDKFDKWENDYPKYTHRYTLFHIDIPVDIFSKKLSLKNLCYLCSIPVKQEGKGSDVENYFHNGDLKKIAKYCSEDVKATAMLFAYINKHLLFKQYNFPDVEYIESLDVKIEIQK